MCASVHSVYSGRQVQARRRHKHSTILRVMPPAKRIPYTEEQYKIGKCQQANKINNKSKAIAWHIEIGCNFRQVPVQIWM